MAAYCQVYDSHHLQADCQEPGSAPEPYASVIEYGLPFLYKGGGGGVPKHTEYRCSLLLQMEWSDPSACVVGTSMSHAKMAEAIEMPFGADSHGPRSHV